MKDITKSLENVIKDEKIAIDARRKEFDLPASDGDLTGIALSGGGIRSATVCMGVLSFFNKCGLLQKTDYLSSVSGGGYTASYVHATLKENDADPEAFNELFNDDHIKRFKNNGNYLGSNFFGCCRIAGAFIFSFVMNLVWVLATFVAVSTFLGLILKGITTQIDKYYGEVLLSAALIVLIIHFLFHGLRGLVWRSNTLYKIEGIIFVFAAPYAFYHLFMAFAGNGGFFTNILLECRFTKPAGQFICDNIFGNHYLASFAISILLLYLVGFFANPNILTFHRFYRDRLAKAYLFLAEGVDKTFKLFTLIPGATKDGKIVSEPGASDWKAAPYPLINTCLNLLGWSKKDNKKRFFLVTVIKMILNIYCRDEKKKDKKDFAGTATNEHFLLSPLYCGSELTGYVPSNSIGYRSMTLATAMAVSGAAVNPSMGHKTNRFLAFLMTLLNMRLGYWSANPACRPLHRFTWWPAYHLAELFSKSNINRPRVLLSDGGHIENLGIFELLRRRCRLIIAVDSGADPGYTFSDLQSLVIQARNILDLKIDFIIKPEDNIRPDPSFAFSKEHFAAAKISALEGADGHDSYHGILIYIKSSLKAPNTAREKNKIRSYDYKTWHTAFPHESTVDQFFDEDQWDAYYTLGQHMAEETLKKALGVDEKKKINAEECRQKGLEDWITTFEEMVSSP